MALFVNQLVLLSMLLFAMLIQFQIIWPAESALLEYSHIEVASLFFLPHGLKAICIVLAGARAIIPIFMMHFITDLAIGWPLPTALITGGVAVVVMLLPLVLINFLSHKPALEPLTLGSTKDLSLFRLVIVVAVIASLMNGAIGALRYQSSPLDLVAFKFFTGDILGTLAVLGVLIWIKRPLMRVANRLSNLN